MVIRLVALSISSVVSKESIFMKCSIRTYYIISLCIKLLLGFLFLQVDLRKTAIAVHDSIYIYG